MNVHFTARRTDLTPEVRQYCEKRLKALEKLLGSVLDVDIILIRARRRGAKAEIHVQDKGAGLVVVEETPDMLNSLNLAFDALETQGQEGAGEVPGASGAARAASAGSSACRPRRPRNPAGKDRPEPALLAQAHVRRGGRRSSST